MFMVFLIIAFLAMLFVAVMGGGPRGPRNRR